MSSWMTEAERFVRLNRERRHLFPRALLAGLLAGCAAVGFHLGMDAGEAWRARLQDFAHGYGASGLAIAAAASALCVFLAAWLVERFAPEAAGSGIPHVKAVLMGLRGFRWARVLAVKFLSGLIGMGGGLTLGREGPTVQMGGAVAEGVATACSSSPDERRALIAAGAGAGLAAAFNAPLSGLIFVLEELRERCSSPEFFAAAVACLAADTVCRLALGELPAFRVGISGAPSLTMLPVFVGLGVSCGLLGVAFNRTLLAVQRLCPGRPGSRKAFWLGWGGSIGLVGWLAPDLLGGGQGLVGRILDGEASLAPSLVALYFAARFALTIGSYATGAAGGIFAPILLLGALLGLGSGTLIQQMAPVLPVEPKVFAVAGMAALFTGVVQAPLTGVVLMIEMTGNYALILPLLAACFAAQAVAARLHDLPIYEALLERELRESRGRRSR
ncbi:H(+)/Cl(-) exchange transporter ClcA [Methylococcus capsulatus]|uniref:H(+)/Cl(-) exchange transporter ClcA n=1 Tax=Methylococcus capsulatus TaxID=414 RepID=UPI002017D8CC|nr:H(+)/Cl(-) exchange transporter ClcA [Methylococcus capsulatus]UQN11905.1 H(+)/Cl(-) exchange transporter ClcA [Methylococcus capsulatus]